MLTGVLLACSALGAQTPAPAQQPTFRLKKTVRLVEVDVIAKDKRGHPATGLTAKDFLLLDNGKVQTISRFAIEHSSETPENSSAPIVEAQPNQGPTFSNVHPANVAATVILFDRLNTPAEDQPWMKTQLLQALNHLKPETPVALLFLGNDLTVVSDFTTSAISLGNALEDRQGIRQEGFGPPIVARATGNATRDALILKAASQAFRAEEREKVGRTLAALNIICEQLSRMRGRKSLLWLTAGLSVPGELPAVQAAVDKLNDANVAVYTVDARGVAMDYGGGADTDTTDLTAPIHEENEQTRGDVIDVIAKSTGGIYYHNTNRLDGAINQAIADRSLVYTLAYYPQHDDWQGKFHKLEVKVLRPGVRLRYRTGYLATPVPEPTAQDQQQMLAAVAISPLDCSGIRFNVEVLAGRLQSDPRFVLHIPPEELQLAGRDEQMTGAVQVWFIQKRATGEDLFTSTSKGDLNLPKSAYQIALKQGVAVASDVKLHEGAAKIRVVLRDTNSGKVGTVDVPLAALPAQQQN